MTQAAVEIPTGAPATGAGTGSRPGRPRDESRDDAIRTAVLELLGEVGYGDLTMDAVAARARAGKATIYRRWPNKADMVLDAVRCAHPDHEHHPDTGSLRGDLRGMLSVFCEMLNSSLGCTALALMGELPRNPDLAQAFRAGFLTDKLAASERVVARAVARGEARPDADASLVTQIGPALFLYRALVTGQRVDQALVDEIVDDVLLPLLSP